MRTFKNLHDIVTIRQGLEFPIMAALPIQSSSIEASPDFVCLYIRNSMFHDVEHFDKCMIVYFAVVIYYRTCIRQPNCKNDLIGTAWGAVG